MKVRTYILLAAMTYSILCLCNSGIALEKVVRSTDMPVFIPESSANINAAPFYNRPGNRIKQLHKDVADLMKIGENYVELPIRQTDNDWYFSREIEFLHRIYFFDIVKFEVIQQDNDINGYRVVAHAKKAYAHIIVPPFWYMLDRRERMVVNLAVNTDKGKAIDIYSTWKFLSGQ